MRDVMAILFASTGLVVVFGILTALAAVGTVAGVQLEAVFQSPELLPFQVWVNALREHKMIPRKKSTDLKVMLERLNNRSPVIISYDGH